MMESHLPTLLQHRDWQTIMFGAYWKTKKEIFGLDYQEDFFALREIQLSMFLKMARGIENIKYERITLTADTQTKQTCVALTTGNSKQK